MSLVIGQPAPDFTLVNQFGESVTLSSFKGKKNLVVVFIPFAFTGTCTGELCALRDDLSSFQNESAELLAVHAESVCDPGGL
jgi:peroxiredoxin